MFEVQIDNLTTGETWVTRMSAAGAEEALAKMLRRKLTANWLLDGGQFQFTSVEVFDGQLYELAPQDQADAGMTNYPDGNA